MKLCEWHKQLQLPNYFVRLTENLITNTNMIIAAKVRTAIIMLILRKIRNGKKCVKTVQMRSYFRSVFSCIRTRSEKSLKSKKEQCVCWSRKILSFCFQLGVFSRRDGNETVIETKAIKKQQYWNENNITVTIIRSDGPSNC